MDWSTPLAIYHLPLFVSYELIVMFLCTVYLGPLDADLVEQYIYTTESSPERGSTRESERENRHLK